MTSLSKIFRVDNDNYLKAKSCLKRVKENIDDYYQQIPDGTASEILFLKNIWKDLPTTFGEGIKVMGIDKQVDYQLLLVKCNPNSVLYNFNNFKYEFIKVVRGNLFNHNDNRSYVQGDSFILDNDIQNKLFFNEESFLYLMLVNDNSAIDRDIFKKKKFKEIIKNNQ